MLALLLRLRLRIRLRLRQKKTKTSKYNYVLRAVLALTLSEPKIQKSKTLLRGPKLLDFLVVLGFFWFSNRNPKKHMVFFVFPTEIQKHRVFCFSPETEQANQKNLCFFGFPPKIQKSHVIFWISVGKQKTLGKTKIQKFRAPQKGFGFLDFWHYKTKNPKPV